MSRNTAELERLRAAGTECHWCGRATIRIREWKGVPPDLMATVDHVQCAKTAGSRQARNRSGTVLACKRCNNERNNIVQKLEAGKALCEEQLRFVRAAKAHGHDMDEWIEDVRSTVAPRMRRT